MKLLTEFVETGDETHTVTKAQNADELLANKSSRNKDFSTLYFEFCTESIKRVMKTSQLTK